MNNILDWLNDELIENNYLACYENKDLRDELIDLYYALKEGKIQIPKTDRVDNEANEATLCQYCGKYCYDKEGNKDE